MVHARHSYQQWPQTWQRLLLLKQESQLEAYIIIIREVSLYVITYENPYVVRAGERGQLSYVNLSTDFRRKALSHVGSSVGLFEIFFSHFPGLSMATFKPRESQRTHTVHHVQNIMENAVSVHGAYGWRMQPMRLQSNNAC